MPNSRVQYVMYRSESPNARKGIETLALGEGAVPPPPCQNPRMPERALKRAGGTRPTTLSMSQNPRMPERALKRVRVHGAREHSRESESPNARKGIETSCSRGAPPSQPSRQNPRMPERALKPAINSCAAIAAARQNPRMPERALKPYPSLTPRQ